MFDVVKVPRNQAGTGGFETEHVYEAQTLRDFLLWLGDGNRAVGPGLRYQKPTQQWVEDNILGSGAFRIANKPRLGTPDAASGGDIAFATMVYGFGRSDGVRLSKDRGNKNLALADDEINESKGIWFRRNLPDNGAMTDPDQVESRRKIRRVSDDLLTLFAPQVGS